MSGIASGAVVYTLKHPLDLLDKGGAVVECITELTLQRLKGRDIRLIDGAKGQGAVMLAMLARSANLPPGTVDELDGQDATDAGVIVMGFLEATPPTGAT